jgi:RNA polymerase sigma factor (sigma-70 family)
MPAISPALVARLRAAHPAPDRDLLRAFLADRSEPAFAALVSRHGPMVLGVCRRVLGDPHDADDAFQATFLVLARKANAVGRPDRLPGWLHTIAVRTATEVRRMRARRRKLELPGGDCQFLSGGRKPPELAAQGAYAPRSETDARSAEQSELAALLDEELANLPEHYRVPVVLCELQGLPRKEAAARLQLAEGTLSSRLAKARKLLADRLTQRGVTAGAAAITAALAHAALARVPAELAVEAARAALTSAASAAAAHAADGVVKALLVTKLKGLALAVGVVIACAGGSVVMFGGTGSAAGGPGPTAAGADEDADSRALVKQLGSPNFADREKAERKLQALGAKARPALLAGAKNADPEIARRSAAVLKAIRADERAAFLAGKSEPTDPVWKRFKELVGDTKASRELFAEMTAEDRRAELLARAEAAPAKAGEVYAAELARIKDTSSKALKPFFGPITDESSKAAQAALRQAVPAVDVATALFLGVYPLAAGAKDPAEAHSLFKAGFAVGVEGPQKDPLRKLFAAWLDRRTDPTAIRAGLDGALFCGVGEAAPVARRVLADKKATPGLTGKALLVLGHHGARDDLPLLTARRTDDRPTTEQQTATANTQVRDVAAAMALRLLDEDFEKYGFEPMDYIHWQIRPDIAPFRGVGGFATDEARTAAHKKAWDWIDKQPKPEPKKDEPDPEAEKLVKQLGSPAFADRDSAERKLKALGPRVKPVVRAAIKNADPEVARRCQAILDHVLREQAWPRFARLLGDDRDARALFEAIRTVPRNVELIEKAEEQPESVAKLYTDRERELNEQCRNAGEQSWHPGKVSVGEVAGWMYLGTFPGAEEADVGRTNVFLLDFPDMWRHPSKPYPFPAALGEGPLQVGARRILVKWTETRIGRPGFAKGLNGAMAHSVPEMVPVAKKYLTQVKQAGDDHGLCLAAIGKCGTKDDLPFLAKYADDRRVTMRVYMNYPGDEADPPREFRPEKDQAVQLRDVAVVMMLVLNGMTREQLDEFGFFVSRYAPRYTGEVGPPPPLPPVGRRRRADDPFAPFSLGFLRDADREAAHRKAKAWLARKDSPR